MVEVRLLGPVGLVSDGVDVPAGGTKQRAVLAVLALRSPRLASTDQLIDAIWGGDPPGSARNAVQVYVSGLRKSLGAGAVLERAGDGYRLVGPDLSVDASEFVTAVAEGRSALRSGDPARATRVLGAALGRWVGEPLGGVEGLPFHEEARRHLTEVRAVARVDHAEGLLRQGHLAAAQAAARESILDRPYEEQAWSVLARAQYHAGRQRDALQSCRDLRSLLDEELGIDPSPALAQLERAILNQDLTGPTPARVDDPDDPDVAAGPALPELPDPFVGREPLVADLLERLAGTHLVSLVGLGGIGKTTVARAVALRWAAEGRTVHLCELETETTARGALERICRQTGLDPERDEISFSSLGPDVLVVLDNVEQIDDFALSFGPALKGARAAWLVTSRRPLRLQAETVVHLGPLSLETDGTAPSPAARLFLALAERARPGLDRAEAVSSGESVCGMLDGIPLAIELTASRTRVLTVDQVRARLERGTVSALDASRAVDVPARQVSLAAIVASTVGTLDPQACELLDWLVSMSGWTSIELVDEVVERARQPEAADRVDDLVDAGLVEADDDGRVRVRTPVRDFLVRQGDRSRRDGVVIDVVADLVTSVAPTLFGATATTGQARLERDHDTVTASLTKAVEHALADRAAEITLGLNRYWLLTGRWSEAGRFIEAVLALPSLPPEVAVRLRILDGTFGSYANDPAAAQPLLAALREAEALGSELDRLVVNGWCCLAALDAQRGRGDVAVGHAAEAVRLAQLSGSPALQSLARDVVGFVAAYRGDYDTAIEASLAGLADARRSGDTNDVVNLLACISDDLVGLGRFDEGLVLATEGFELMRELGPGPLLGSVLSANAFCLLGLGRVAEARGLLVEALRLTRDQVSNPIWLGDRLAALAVASALDRADEQAARTWGAAEGVLQDEGTSARSHLPAAFVAHIDDLAARLGERFPELARSGSGSRDAVIEGLLA